MTKKPHMKLALAIFSAIMALLYIAIGIYLIAGDRQFMDQVVNPTILIIFGVILICMGCLRGLRAYQLLNTYRNAH